MSGGGGSPKGPSAEEKELWSTQSEIGRGLWESYRQHGEPILTDLAAEARGPVSRGVLASRASAAGADVDQSYDAAETEYRRELGRYGMNPASGRYAGGLRSLALGRAASKAGAMTTARRSAREDHDRKRFAVLAGAQGQSGQGVQALSNVSHSMGQSRANMNMARAQQAAGFGQLLGTGLTAAATFFSDRRMKKDAKKVGESADGIPIYEFRYKGDKRKSGPKQVGMMAQDVEKVAPEAVVDVGGLKAVDYFKVRERQKEKASLARERIGKTVSHYAGEIAEHTPKFAKWAAGEVEDAVGPLVDEAGNFISEHMPELPGNLLERKRGRRRGAAAPVMAVPERASLRAARQSASNRRRKRRRAQMPGVDINPDALAAIEENMTPERLSKWQGLLSDLEPTRRPKNLVDLVERKRSEYGMAAGR